MRAFIAIEIPEEIKKEIIKIQNQLPEFKGKKTEFENLHLTLKFLGEVDKNKINEIKKKLNEIKIKKFEVEIDSIGSFDNRKSRVYPKNFIVWLNMKNCEKLQKEIDEKLKDLFEREKRFMGHLTIVRVKDVKDKKKFVEELKKIKIPKMKFYVNNFYLRESNLTEEKPIYKTLEKFNLEI